MTRDEAWCRFAAACGAAESDEAMILDERERLRRWAADAGRRADALLAEWERRFPVGDRPEDP